MIELTLEEAKRYGIECCKHCGYPENNHFVFDNRLCAHDQKCPGYELGTRAGVLRYRSAT